MPFISSSPNTTEAQTMETIDDIARELERTNLSRAPGVLRHLEQLNEPLAEMGNAEPPRLQQNSNLDM